MARLRNPALTSPATSDSMQNKADERCKRTFACVSLGIVFVVIIGLIYWQVSDNSHKGRILQGQLSELLWDRLSHNLYVQIPSGEKTYLNIDVGGLADPELGFPFVQNFCWLNKTSFCYRWHSKVDLKITLDPGAMGNAECYNFIWEPSRCHMKLKNCFTSEAKWYGVTTDFSGQPYLHGGLGGRDEFTSDLEHYFLSSSGVAILLTSSLPVQVGTEHHKQLCVRVHMSQLTAPLKYRVCVARNLKDVHRDMTRQHYASGPVPVAPNMDILRIARWNFPEGVKTATRLEQDLRALSNRLRRHSLEPFVISLDEPSTTLLLAPDTAHTHAHWRSISLVQHLNLSITLSPFISLNALKVHRSQREPIDPKMLVTSQSAPGSQETPILTRRMSGELAVKLDLSQPSAAHWFAKQVAKATAYLGAEYVVMDTGVGSSVEEDPMRVKESLRRLGHVAAQTSCGTILTSVLGTFSEFGLFVKMPALVADWGYSGLKGIIPVVIHYSLLGYTFLVPDSIGGSRSQEEEVDEELFIRWLEISSFLPVISFHKPPWAFNDESVLRLTRSYLSMHQDFVVPLLQTHLQQWSSDHSPLYRPLWWIAPDDPFTLSIDDQFLIGDEVLVAPVTEQGAMARDVYLPGSKLLWRERTSGNIFPGGTLLRGHPVALEQVAVFTRVPT